MKKTTLFYAFLILLLASCVREGSLESGSSPALLLPDEIKVSGPGADDPDVKSVTPDGVSVYWEKGDQIALFTGAIEESQRRNHAIYTADIEGEPQPEATFLRETDMWQYEEGDLYLAAYPAASIDRWGSSEKLTAYAILPTVQTARQGAWDPAAGILAGSSNTSEFIFNHAVAYVKFIVDGSTSSFVSMSVAYPDISSFPMGEGTHVNASVANQLVIYYYDGNEISVIDYNASSSVVLKDYDLVPFPSAKAVLNSPDGQPFAPGIYYVAIMPRVYSNGLSCVFTDAEGKVAVKKLEGPIDVKRGDVLNVKTVGSLDFKTPIQNHTVWSENGRNQGVVFWVDDADPTRAKIVSICDHVDNCWSKKTDPFGIEDPEATIDNYNAIVSREDFNESDFPAVGYCKQLRETIGGEWHLPSIVDMRLLYNSYYARNYLSPLSGSINSTDDSGNSVQIPGHDFRYRPDNMTKKDYQTVLATKKNFDDLLYSIGEPSPASLDGTVVIDSGGSYSIDPDSLNDEFGSPEGVNYWLSNETKKSGTTQGKNARLARIGQYRLPNSLKTNKHYIRCIKEVSIAD